MSTPDPMEFQLRDKRTAKLFYEDIQSLELTCGWNGDRVVRVIPLFNADADAVAIVAERHGATRGVF